MVRTNMTLASPAFSISVGYVDRYSTRNSHQTEIEYLRFSDFPARQEARFEPLPAFTNCSTYLHSHAASSPSKLLNNPDGQLMPPLAMRVVAHHAFFERDLDRLVYKLARLIARAYHA